MTPARLIVLIFPFLLAACTSTRYTWENYDGALYRHYRNPADAEQFVEDLKKVVLAGEETGSVPPGLYAEYGYALYEKGRAAESILYFQKEYDKWPESRALMATMMETAKMRADEEKQQSNDTRKEPDGKSR
jgi:hypothetical protein